MIEKESNNNQLIEVRELISNIDIPSCPSCDCKLTNQCYVPITDFSALLKNNANIRDYELNVYDCSEFSEELDQRLDAQGFKSKTKLVRIDCDTWTNDWDYLDTTFGYDYEMCKDNNLHLIVELSKIYIEATTGEVIMPKDYERYGLN
jgi:hypothetical protein